MEFLNFFAQRLNVSRSEANQLLERTLTNYRPARDYSTRFLDAHEPEHDLRRNNSNETRS